MLLRTKFFISFKEAPEIICMADEFYMFFDAMMANYSTKTGTDTTHVILHVRTSSFAYVCVQQLRMVVVKDQFSY